MKIDFDAPRTSALNKHLDEIGKHEIEWENLLQQLDEVLDDVDVSELVREFLTLTPAQEEMFSKVVFYVSYIT